LFLLLLLLRRGTLSLAAALLAAAATLDLGHDALDVRLDRVLVDTLAPLTLLLVLALTTPVGRVPFRLDPDLSPGSGAGRGSGRGPTDASHGTIGGSRPSGRRRGTRACALALLLRGDLRFRDLGFGLLVLRLLGLQDGGVLLVLPVRAFVVFEVELVGRLRFDVFLLVRRVRLGLLRLDLGGLGSLDGHLGIDFGRLFVRLRLGLGLLGLRRFVTF